MDQRITVRRKRYKLRFTKLAKNVYGECDPPNQSGKEIRVDESLHGQELLDTLIHELVHAALWDVAEESVYEIGSDIARVLWKLGYRAPWDVENQGE